MRLIISSFWVSTAVVVLLNFAFNPRTSTLNTLRMNPNDIKLNAVNEFMQLSVKQQLLLAELSYSFLEMDGVLSSVNALRKSESHNPGENKSRVIQFLSRIFQVK